MFNRFMSDVAEQYSYLRHTPAELETKLAYALLKYELSRQYFELTERLTVEFSDVDPYPSSAAMFEDISAGRLIVYTCADMPVDHPFTELHTPTRQPYNVIFRAVHDGCAHFPERNNFSAIGEFRAFRAHCRLMPGNLRAFQALAAETLGQNSWVNFGYVNRTLEQSAQLYAEQKAALLPWRIVRQALTEVEV
jgi:hypothetical protein